MRAILVTTAKKAETLLNELEFAAVCGLDTESVGPTLRNRKKPFINVAKSHLLGFSVAFENERAYYIPVTHKGANLPFTDIANILSAVATVPRVWMHNVKHDAQVLKQAGYTIPPGLVDSYLAAWLALSRELGLGLKQLTEEIFDRVPPKYDGNLGSLTGQEALQYGAWDSLNTLQLGEHFLPRLKELDLAQHMARTEVPFALLLARMETHGMPINYRVLLDVANECRPILRKILTDWDQLFPGISISSGTQLQELFVKGIWRASGSTPGGAYSTKAEVIAQQLRYCPAGSPGRQAATLRLKYMELAKMVSTYTVGIVEECKQWPDGRGHPGFNQVGPRTGRLSSSDFNAQNWPADDVWGPRIRSAVIPSRPGLTLTGCDYSQIELRILAHYSGGRLLEAFERDADMHQETADAMGVTRAMGKTVNFGYLAYGGTAGGLAHKLGIPYADAKRKKANLETAYSHISAFRAKVIAAAMARKPRPWVKTIIGRRRFIPQLLSASKKEREHGERVALNTIIQGSAADMMKLAMLAIDEHARRVKIKDYAMIATIHDEVICESSEPKWLAQIIQDEMVAVGKKLELRCPIQAKPKSGKTWAEIK